MGFPDCNNGNYKSNTDVHLNLGQSLHEYVNSNQDYTKVNIDVYRVGRGVIQYVHVRIRHFLRHLFRVS